MTKMFLITMATLSLLTTGLAAEVSDKQELSASEQFRLMKYGIFCTVRHHRAPEVDTTEFYNAYDWEQFAKDVEEMGVDYVILTAWHRPMNVNYPSKVIAGVREGGEAHVSKIDFVEKIHGLLNPKGIAVIWYSAPAGALWFSEADKKTVHFGTDFEKHNDFLCDGVYDEFCKRYGKKLFGHWLDKPGWGTIDQARLGNTLRKYHPETVILVNNRDGLTPTRPKHKKNDKNWKSPWSYGDGVFYASEGKPLKECRRMRSRPWRCTDGQFCIPYGGWWYHRKAEARWTTEEIVRFTAFQASASIGGGIAWAAGIAPGKAPIWEKNVKENMVRANKIMAPYREAITGTVPDTSYPTELNTTMADQVSGSRPRNRPMVATPTSASSTRRRVRHLRWTCLWMM